MTWHPIETAPTDGTWVLANVDDVIIEAHYYDGEWRPAKCSSHGCGCCAESNSPPTHWMPIPPMPEDK